MKHKLWCATVPRPMDQYHSNAEITQLAALKCDCGAETKTPTVSDPTSAHTPTPWKIMTGLHDTSWIEDSSDCPIVRCETHSSLPACDNAKFIVRAVNSHQMLLDACQQIASEIQGFQNVPSLKAMEMIHKAIQEATREL